MSTSLANEELEKVNSINTREAAVIDISKVRLVNREIVSDSAATISLVQYELPRIKYQSNSTQPGLAVFSEIYYPVGWTATIDGKEVPILRADFTLRALEVPAGQHVIEFNFKPDAYYVGDKVTMGSSWILLLFVLGSLVWTWRGNPGKPE